MNIALQRFEGTALLVAHDQDLIEEVGTRIWPLDQHTITDFKGAYKQYTAALA